MVAGDERIVVDESEQTGPRILVTFSLRQGTQHRNKTMRQSFVRGLTLAGFCVTTLALCTQHVSAADDPIDAIPDSAGAVMHFKVPRTTIRKASNLANLLDKSYGPKLTAMSKQLGLLIANPRGRGVDPKRDWWIVVFPNPEGPTAIVYGIPAKQLDAMEQAIGKGYLFIRHGKWLFYTQDAAAAKTIRGRIAGRGKSIAANMDTSSRQLLTRGDVSVYVNVRRLTEIYKIEIDTASQEFETALDELAKASSGGSAGNLKPAFKMYAKMFRGVLQGLKDTHSFTAAVTVNNKGIAIEEYCHVTPLSATDKFLQANQPSEMSVMAKLPDDKLIYWGMHGNLAGMSQWAMNYSSGMFSGNPTDATAMKKVMAEYAKLKIGTIAGAFSLGSLDEGLIRTIGVTEVTPVEKMRALTRQVIKAMSNLNTGGVKQTIDLKPDAEKYGKYSADVMVTKIEAPAGPGPGGAMAEQMIEKMFGPEGITTRAVYLKGMAVQTLGGGKAAMEEALASLNGTGRSGSSPGSSGNAAKIMRSARSRLGKTSNLTLLIDLPGLIAEGVKMASAAAPLPFLPAPAEIDKLGIKRSFLGFSLTTEPAGLRMKTFVPLAQIEGISKIVGLFKGLLPQMLPGGGLPGQQFRRQEF